MAGAPRHCSTAEPSPRLPGRGGDRASQPAAANGHLVSLITAPNMYDANERKAAGLWGRTRTTISSSPNAWPAPALPLFPVITALCTRLQLERAAQRTATHDGNRRAAQVAAPHRADMANAAQQAPGPVEQQTWVRGAARPAACSVPPTAPQRPRGPAPEEPRYHGGLRKAAPPPQRPHAPPQSAAAPPPPPTDLSHPSPPWQVQCDACEKWRRVPADLAESLADDEPWWVLRPRAGRRRRPPRLDAARAPADCWPPCRTCRFCANNPDAAHNTCDAPQELTDAEIDHLHAETVRAAAPCHLVSLRQRRCPAVQLCTAAAPVS